MQVRLWAWWLALDGEFCAPGEVLNVAAAEAVAICEQGAGEVVTTRPEYELAAIAPVELAVAKSTPRRRARR